MWEGQNEAHLTDHRLPAVLTFLSGEFCAPKERTPKSHRGGDGTEKEVKPPGTVLVQGTQRKRWGGLLGRAGKRAPHSDAVLRLPGHLHLEGLWPPVLVKASL